MRIIIKTHQRGYGTHYYLSSKNEQKKRTLRAGMLADMAIGIETARMYYLAAAYMFDHPENYGPPVSDFILSRASIAKAHAADGSFSCGKAGPSPDASTCAEGFMTTTYRYSHSSRQVFPSLFFIIF